MDFVLTNGGKNSHSSSSAPVSLEQTPDPVPEKSINILPAAPLLSCSLSAKEERSEEEALSLTSNILLTKVEDR